MRNRTGRKAFSSALRGKVRRFFRTDRGSAMIELGVAYLARIYYTSITVANAARAGAAFGADTAATDSAMTVAAQNDAGSLTLDTITAGRYCICPGTGVVACSTANCAGYGVPQAYD